MPCGAAARVSAARSGGPAGSGGSVSAWALGVRLFDRTSRRVVLSQAGRAVLGQARRALRESDRAVSLARLAARGDWGELAISVLPAVTLALLPAIIRAHRDAHPAIGVRISESFDDEQLAALTAGRIDAGLLRTIVAASYQALSLDGVRYVPVVGHRLTLQLAWAADNANTALAGFLQTAHQIAGRPTRPVPDDPPPAEP